jgi:hypothetical protein
VGHYTTDRQNTGTWSVGALVDSLDRHNHWCNSRERPSGDIRGPSWNSPRRSKRKCQGRRCNLYLESVL